MNNRTYLLILLGATVAFVFLEPQRLIILLEEYLQKLFENDVKQEDQSLRNLSQVQIYEDKILLAKDIEGGLEGLIKMAKELHNALPTTPRNRRKYGANTQHDDYLKYSSTEDQIVQSLNLLEEMSQEVEAAYVLGGLGAWGLLPQLPPDVSKQALIDAARVGDVRATLALADRYLTGRGVPANCQEAYRLLFEVGTLYVDEIVQDVSQPSQLPPTDLEERYTYSFQTSLREEFYGEEQLAFEQSLADAGDVEGVSEVAYKLLHGLGMQKNHQQAYTLFTNAAGQGDAFAMAQLGLMHAKGWHVPINYTKAKEWYEKAARLQEPLAFHNLGVLHFNGLGVKQDYAKARQYFNQAVELQHPDAYHAIGAMYMHGIGVPKDPLLAIEFLNVALDLGHERALYELSVLFNEGAGVEGGADCHKAFYYMMIFLDGVSDWGIEIDNVVDILDQGKQWEALLLFSLLGDQGHPVALRNAAWLLTHGQGNYTHNNATDIALHMYLELAKRNESLSMVNAADLLRQFQNPNYAQIIELYQHSIQYGEVSAMTNLGQMYEKGEGVPKNWTKALKLYQQAFAQSDVVQLQFASGLLLWWLQLRIWVYEYCSFVQLLGQFRQLYIVCNDGLKRYGLRMDDVVVMLVTFACAWVIGMVVTGRNRVWSIMQRRVLSQRNHNHNQQQQQ